MFGIFKRKVAPQPSAVSAQMRELMFGDIPWGQWAKPDAPDAEPWLTFKAARAALDRNDHSSTVTLLKGIVDTVGYESRCYLQAWHYLRQLNEQPSEAKQLFGVIIEVGINNGLDVLGAYEDHTARYWNFSGAGVVWDHPDQSLDEDIDGLFEVSRLMVNQIGPWDKPRVTTLADGVARVSFLTASGIHFGQGPFSLLAKDGLAGPVIQRGAVVMQKLMAKSKNA